MHASTASDECPSARPWEGRPAILALLRGWRDGEPPDLLEEEPIPGTVPWAPGALEGVGTHHVRVKAHRRKADVVAALRFALERLVRDGDDHARAALYELPLGDRLFPYAGAIQRAVAAQRRPTRAEIRPHARWLVEHAGHREPLKLGVLLLSVVGTADDAGDLELLGAHEEFTLYAANALGRLLPDPLDAWWRMARRARGWGKVLLVERLARRAAERPGLRRWLLCHGGEPGVLGEYVALARATAGDLAGALAADAVDDELLDAGCDLVQVLLSEGPAAGISAYPDGVRAVARLLDVLADRCDSFERLQAVAELYRWLEWPRPPPLRGWWRFEPKRDRPPPRWSGEWAERMRALGWAELTRARLAGHCRRILGRPEWQSAVRAAYASDDGRRRWRAWDVSLVLGVDLWEEAFRRLADDPFDPGLGNELVETDDPGRVARLIAYAAAHVRFPDVPREQWDQRSPTAQWEEQHLLGYLVDLIAHGAPFCWELVGAALRSPRLRVRRSAVAATRAHLGSLGPEARVAVEGAVAQEPDRNLRRRLRRLAARLR